LNESNRTDRGTLTEVLALDDAERASRLDFLEVRQRDLEVLEELRALLGPHLDSLVERWHGFLTAHPKTRELLPAGRLGEHLRTMQARYFRRLLAGRIDREYFEDRLRIGFVHEHVGLEPALYMGAYRKFQDMVREHLLGEGHPLQRVAAWLRALEKIIYLDMELALDAYFHTRNQAVIASNASLSRLAGELELRNRELSEQFQRAQEAGRLKDELLSRVSHEIRTPLNAILGFADLLADGIDGPVTGEQETSLRKIRRHGERLLGIFDELIDGARLAASGAAARRPFDPTPVLVEAAARAREQAQAKGLAFAVRIEEALPHVRGDRAGFSAALGHVLDNACKFTLAGEVLLEAMRVAGGVRVQVRDTGPGIPPEHRDRIFDPFHQVEVGDTRTVSGVGMGLALARQALEHMGGSLELVAAGPRGSTFAMELPESPGEPPQP
jgi:signal transduction histidine kinase